MSEKNNIYVLHVYLNDELIKNEFYNSLYEAMESVNIWNELDMDKILLFDIEEV